MYLCFFLCAYIYIYIYIYMCIYIHIYIYINTHQHTYIHTHADTNGSYTCACNHGYEGSGVHCTNTNECTSTNNLHNCGIHANCTDTNGSFVCFCNQTGYGVSAPNALDCWDTDECEAETHNCSRHAQVTRAIYACLFPHVYVCTYIHAYIYVCMLYIYIYIYMYAICI